MMVSFGIDVGATKTLAVVIDGAGRVLDSTSEPTSRGAEGVVRTVCSVMGQLRSRYGPEPLYPVGIGVPGLVDVDAGTVRHAINLGLDGEPVALRSWLTAELRCPVVLDNDVNAATLGVARLVGATDLAYLSIGTGLAAGLVLDGRLRRGSSFAAGEIGHVGFDPGGIASQCGQRGCLETVASGSALEAAWSSPGTWPARAVFDAAEAGDIVALAVRRRFAGAVAAAIRLLVMTVDVRQIVLGGGVAQLGGRLREVVAGALAEEAERSSFVASLSLAERLRVVPPDRTVTALGAALMGRAGEDT